MKKQIVELLNKYAESQPALRLPNEPLEKSNPMLGDEIVAYEAANAADWSGDAPKTLAEALDRIAAAIGPIA